VGQAKINIKKIVLAALIGSTIFTVVIVGFNYLVFREFSLIKTIVYFFLGIILYGFLAYRSNKKQIR